MSGPAERRTFEQFVAIHALDPMDEALASAMRAMMLASKGARQGIEARGQFDALMESVSPRDDVTYEAGVIGGIPGFWVLPKHWRSDGAIIHLHGGWFNFGSAKAYRHLMGHVAATVRARVFIPDYRLAPEHPFPAAPQDALACYLALVDSGVQRIAITGDSAGGNLALVLASRVIGQAAAIRATLVGVTVLSPITDLTFSGTTYVTRADADPLFTRSQVEELVHAYLRGADAKHPLASPLLGRFSGMPPIRIHVGDDEVLLDDSLRYVGRAIAAGVDAKVDVWEGLPHGFIGSIGRLNAATQVLEAISRFLIERLQSNGES